MDSSPWRRVGQECVLSLLGEVGALPSVPRRIVQRRQPLHVGEPGESSRLPRGEMATHRGCLRVRVEKCRLDEKNVGLFSQPNDFFDIRIRKGAIDDIDDFAPRGDFHDLFLEQAKRKGGGLFGLGVKPGDIDKERRRPRRGGSPP